MNWLDNRLHELLPGLSPARLRELGAAAVRLDLVKGAQLLAAGEHWRHLWLIERGALRLFYLGADGAESNKNFYLDGQLLWPITHKLRTEPVGFFVASVEASAVHALRMEHLEALIGAEADWTALKLQALQQLLDEKMWREQMFLQGDAAQRYQQLRMVRPQWSERIPLRHQASWLGITDVSLSRLRASMGVI